MKEMKLVIDIPNKVYSYVNTQWRDLPRNDSPISIMCNAIIDGTPLDYIIADIEVARDKDKLCEYPYNRCINIINKTGSVKICKTCFCEDYNKNLYPCCECNRNHNRGYDKWSAKVE